MHRRVRIEHKPPSSLEVPWGSQTASMDVTEWYAIVLGGLVALSIVAFLLLTIFKKTGTFLLLAIFKAGTYAKLRFLKYVYYPQVHRYLSGSEKTTRFDLVLIFVYLVGITLCTTVQVKDISALTRRSGFISIINLIPLSLGAHMNILANYGGITLSVYSRMHRWLRRVAIAEGLVHTAAAVFLRRPSLRILSDIGGLAVSNKCNC